MKRKILGFVAVAALALAGCKKKGNTEIVDPADEDRTADRNTGRVDTGRGSADDRGTKATVTADDGDDLPQTAAVYFEFDSAKLGADARGELQQLADWLNGHPKAKITIQGHTDERGTDEYNLALGDRRAVAIKDYLAKLGVAASRLATISYGEERPAASGDDEGAYAQNRRGELVPDR